MEPTARVRLRVSPGARKTEIAGRHGDAWKVRVTAPAEGGRANDAVLKLLAERLGLPRRSLSIVSGQTGRDKVVQMAGIDSQETDRRLEQDVRS
ncbi:MAG TPA: DUF167 domain-containing protein [Gaiellaceae bacterium]|nr:DUF167 domain-containing protein [Gaiellaceae bacterium]